MIRALIESIRKARIWIVRALAVGMSVFVVLVHVLAHFGIIGEQLIKPDYFLPAGFLLLWLMFEVQLSTAERELPRASLAPPLLDWHKALPEIVNAVSRANKTVYIVGSSSESIYVSLKDTLEKLSNVEVVVILRSCKSSDKPRITKQNQYLKYWQKLNNPQTGVKVILRFYPNNFFRAIIVDSSEGFLGFYEKKDDRLYGHSVPVMHVRKGTHLEDYLLGVYLNRVSQMREDGSDTPC
jgi:hypothetical protein